MTSNPLSLTPLVNWTLFNGGRWINEKDHNINREEDRIWLWYLVRIFIGCYNFSFRKKNSNSIFHRSNTLINCFLVLVFFSSFVFVPFWLCLLWWFFTRQSREQSKKLSNNKRNQQLERERHASLLSEMKQQLDENDRNHSETKVNCYVHETIYREYAGGHVMMTGF